MATLRKQPFPYKFMLSISNDCDEGGWSSEYTNPQYYNHVDNAKALKWWNNILGVDVCSTAFVVEDIPTYDYDNAAGYGNVFPHPVGMAGDTWKTPSATAEDVEKYIKCGWVGGLHSFGTFSPASKLYDPAKGVTETGGNRAWFQFYMNEWFRAKGLGRFVNYWVDHSPYFHNWRFDQDPEGAALLDGMQNWQDFAEGFKNRAWGSKGDDPTSSFYHTDLTVGRDAIRYVWDKEYSGWTNGSAGWLGSTPVGDWHRNEPQVTGFTAGSEGNTWIETYCSHPTFIYPMSMRNGDKAWGYARQLWEGHWPRHIDTFVNWLETPGIQAKVVGEGGFVSLYTHFFNVYGNQGFNPDGSPVNTYVKNVDTRIAALHTSGIALISRETRALDYALARGDALDQSGDWGVRWIEIGDTIYVTHVVDECFGNFTPELRQLRGVTWLVEAENTALYVGGSPVDESEIDRNWDATAGKWAVGIKWYAPDTTDYTAKTLGEVDVLFDSVTAPEFEAASSPLYFDLGESVIVGIDLGVTADTGLGTDAATLGKWLPFPAATDTGRGSDVITLGTRMGVSTTDTGRGLDAATLGSWQPLTVTESGRGWDSCVLATIVGLAFDLGESLVQPGVELGVIEIGGSGSDIMQLGVIRDLSSITDSGRGSDGCTIESVVTAFAYADTGRSSDLWVVEMVEIAIPLPEVVDSGAGSDSIGLGLISPLIYTDGGRGQDTFPLSGFTITGRRPGRVSTGGKKQVMIGGGRPIVKVSSRSRKEP